MPLDDFFQRVDGFLLDKQRQGASTHTLSAYQRDLKQLQNIVSDTDTGNLKNTLIFALKTLSMKGLHPRSMARKLSVWRSYIQYLIAQQQLHEDPTLGLKAPKQPVRLPKAIAQEELNNLLDTGKKKADSFYDLRDQAIFELLYGSGLRVSEVAALNVADVNLSDAWVRVQGKGRRIRYTPLTQGSIDALQNYIPLHTKSDTQSALFISKQGNRISTRRIQQCLREWAIKHQSTRHISPHMLRHSFAGHVLQSSRNIRAVQELLGHRRLSTTQIYTKLDFDHLAKVYDESHPRAKKKD